MDGATPPLPEVTCTFGHYTQTGPWTDRRTMPWADLARLLTTHEVGAKEGTGIVPATFSGTRRHKNDAARIEVVLLDSDCGHTLDEIGAALARRGWATAIASTHSHLTTRTTVRRGNWDRFLRDAPEDAATPKAFLLAKGMLPHVAENARIADEGDEQVVLGHAPCPKFRIALPLLRPWVAAGYDDQGAANAAWRERIEALAAALGLEHDQACTDTSRLFFLPRRPADGPAPETALLDGAACDLFGLPARPRPGRTTEEHGARRQRRRTGPAGDILSHVDGETGEEIDLRAWAREHAGRFEIVTALRARSPRVLHGRVAGARHHLRCVNEAAHTQAGDDLATFAVNASESSSRGFVVHFRHAHCDGRDRLLFLQGMLAAGWLTVEDLTNPTYLAAADKGRPLIRVAGGTIPRVVDAAEKALLRAELGLYQRGPFIVRPGTVMVRTAAEHEVTARRIFEVEEHALAEAMTQAADWEKFDARSENWIPIDAPVKVATTYRQRKGRWRLPVLTGLINAPTLRADGSLLAASGYDPVTGLLLETGATRFPPIPAEPSWDEAREAISILLGLIETFPFVSDADRSVALATILTGCIRRALPTAPLHAFTAPVMGSGKSKLVDLACLVATGREAAVMSQGKTEEEFEKRIGSLLLAGETVIPIDNCEAPLGGEFLCTVLTQTTARTRLLGRSETPELPTNALITATGNNLVLIGDMTRRAVICRLDPGCERPELRRFAQDPVAQVRADRARYLVAALTALRAFHVAGCPQQRDPLGSFETWSRVVRDAMVWLDLADPVDTMESIRGADPTLDALTAVMTHWGEVLGSQKVVVREIIEAATDQVTVTALGALPPARLAFRHPDFREALLAVAGDGGAINGRRLGKWLAAQDGRIVGGRRFKKRGLSAGNQQWQLEAVVSEQREAA
ncbi:hypothetical protein ACE7GA_00945 [Roseomonas sp. CCTCC AB2023176]|uniref:hypothetical protein n=1 Tax=Roseomonas sp. CCTCC AB2023176 TaxID=3342640 RepID=UPI0035D6B0EE